MRKSTIFILVALFLLSNSLSVYGENIKVGILTSNEVQIGSTTTSQLYNLATDTVVLTLAAHTYTKLENINGKIIVQYGNIKLSPFDGPLKLISTKDTGFVNCNKKLYRGSLLIIPSLHTNGELTIINDINIEEYLLSVVPSEMPSKWSLEALKAQAVAARSYSLGYLGRRQEKGYDLESSIQDQVYHGVSSEKPSTTKAVQSTKGQILLNEKGEPLITFFHSSAGGFTDSIENIWGYKADVKPSKHIQPKPDFDDTSPFFNWKKSYSTSQLNSLLSSLNIGSLTKILPINRMISGRVQKVKINGNAGEKTIYGEEFRMLLKLPSSRFNVSNNETMYYFTGKGYGHGLGLSQWGSKALAEKGYDYKKILSHYYSEAKLITLKSNLKK